MKCDYVHIEEARVYGLKNPKFVINGSVMDINATFKILADGKEINYNSLPNLVNCGFCLEAELTNDMRKIEVYAIRNGKEQLICMRENSKLHRVKSKIRKIIKPVEIKIEHLASGFSSFFKAIAHGFKFLWKEHHLLVPPSLWGKYFKASIRKMREIFKKGLYLNPGIGEEYSLWLKRQALAYPREEPKKLKYNPKISMVIPVYNVSRELLSDCLDSILNQSYTNFEICLADDKSTNKETIDTLKDYMKKDKRIKVVFRKENGHISRSTNSAIEIATGEFIGLMDNDDTLDQDALYEVVKLLNEDKTLDMIYTDEDKLDVKGNRRDRHFKADFSPATLLSSNYICHF